MIVATSTVPSTKWLSEILVEESRRYEHELFAGNVAAVRAKENWLNVLGGAWSVLARN